MTIVWQHYAPTKQERIDMARTIYHDFLDAARAAFDLDYASARELYQATKELVGGVPTLGDLFELYQVEPEEVFAEVPYLIGEEHDLWDLLDDRSGLDEYIDEGFELEITATTQGGTPRKGK